MLSVTESLQPFTDFSQIPPDVLANATERGTRFHKWAECYLLDQWAPVSENIRGYVESLKQWRKIAVEETLFVEKEIICPQYQFMGHIDWIGRLKGDPENFITVLDWKTPLVESKTWRIQLSAYWYLAKKLGLNVRRCAALMPRKDGKKAALKEYTEFQACHFNIFLSCLNCTRYFNDK